MLRFQFIILSPAPIFSSQVRSSQFLTHYPLATFSIFIMLRCFHPMPNMALYLLIMCFWRPFFSPFSFNRSITFSFSFFSFSFSLSFSFFLPLSLPLPLSHIHKLNSAHANVFVSLSNRFQSSPLKGNPRCFGISHIPLESISKILYIHFIHKMHYSNRSNNTWAFWACK